MYGLYWDNCNRNCEASIKGFRSCFNGSEVAFDQCPYYLILRLNTAGYCLQINTDTMASISGLPL